MLMPGLVDIHSHPSTEPFFRGIREEHGVPAMFMSGLYERSFAFRTDADGRRAGKTVAYCEMLSTGITIGRRPVRARSVAGSIWRRKAACGCSWHPASLQPVGIWRTSWQLKYAWDEAAGQRSLHDALALIAQAAQHPSGRLSGMVFPAQIDTCTEALLRESCEAAAAQNLPFTTHCAQSVNEFNEMLHRHGRTPIRWAKRHRYSGAAHDPRPRDLHRRALLDALAHQR